MMMLGPSGVGKTTMLTLMYKGLTAGNWRSSFGFAAEHDTAVAMGRAYNTLTEVLNQPIFTRHERLLESTPGVIERNFRITFQGKQKFGVNFSDHGGGLIFESSTSVDFQQFKDKLQRAIVIINVLDGAALMEGSELFAKKINDPFMISELLRDALDDEQEHLVLFVITKCEAWLKDSDGRQALQKKFEASHKEVLDLIQNNDRQNVIGIFMPVKTLGCVEFSEVKKFGEPNEEIIFIRKPGVPFHYEGIEQPLRYALLFALSQHPKIKGWWDTLVDSLTGHDKLFKKALKEFASQRETNYPMYGNKSLLAI